MDRSTATADRAAALAFLLSRIDYERWTTAPYDDARFKLDRMRALLARLGRPDEGLPIVHVAGTKGKGSTAAMIAAALTAAGYRTGLFTSPHLERIEERVAIDGQPISAERFVDLTGELEAVAQALDRDAPDGQGPTYFELTSALAWLHFRRAGAQWGVLEVGMGGRLDCTNVCAPSVSVITSISFDHTKQLGHTLALIAREKAGIIKPGVPVVSGAVEAEPREVIRRVAAEQGSPLLELGRDFAFDYRASPDHALAPGEMDYRRPGDCAADGHRPPDLENLRLGLLGRHQAANAALAIATLVELRRQGWNIPDEAIRRGLAAARSPARVELVGRRPCVILDVAHNAASAKALAEALGERSTGGKRILVLAVSRDKDAAGMLRALAPAFDRLIATKYTSNPRGLEAEELARLCVAAGLADVEVAPNPQAAWQRVRRLATPDDLVCLTGSFFLAGEMRSLVACAPLSTFGA
jgi:dihydrofolate synthase/folylpolyglutamate synthase